MSVVDRRARSTHVCRFETLETRIALSTQGLPDFSVDYLDASTHFVSRTGPVDSSWIMPLGQADPATGSQQVRADYGWTGRGQTVAVIDSGIAWDHEALGGGFGTGFRVVGGWDFTGENDANPYDDGPLGSHGTHVAGIIGADDGVHQGVAPGVDLVGLRVFDDNGAGYFTWVEDALQWVHDHRNDFANPITTVNLSLGTGENSDHTPDYAMLEDEFSQLETDGIFVAVAAGNGFGRYARPGLSYPASSPYVVPVMSVDADGTLSGFSQRQQRAIAAPGRWITSTVPDYVGNQNGRQDDFARYSGTSMASPYVAGASVLLRQAMEFSGSTHVTQDGIYQVMRDTAATVYDPATGQSYKRLDLQAAIDAVMPADDYGSTADQAYDLGTFDHSIAVAGTIGALGDIDYFSFTAGRTGTVTLTAGTTGELQPEWQLDHGAPVRADHVSLDVVRGQTYTLGLSSAAGLGKYTLDGTLTSHFTYTDWGEIDFAQFTGVRHGGADAWYRIEAARDGLLTVEARFDKTLGAAALELHDKDLGLVAGSRGPGGTARVDTTAAAGDVFFVHVVGTNRNMDFRVANLVSQDGAAVRVEGTAGDDVFRFVPGTTHQFVVNGVCYEFESLQVTDFRFDGGAGRDFAPLAGSIGDDVAAIRPGSAELSGPGYSVTVTGVESLLINGRLGADRADFYDSGGNDVFIGKPALAKLYGPGFHNYVTHFTYVDAHGSAGDDTAYLYDSPDSDQFRVEGTSSSLDGPGFSNRVSHFEHVTAFAANGRDDQAAFAGLGVGDTVYGRGDLVRATTKSCAGEAHGFGHVVVSTDNGVPARADVKSIDYVFEKLGRWV